MADQDTDLSWLPNGGAGIDERLNRGKGLTMTTTKPQDQITMAFTAVCNDDGSFGIGAAERDKPGYWPMPGHGKFPTYEQASAHAHTLNGKLGILTDTADAIVCSSMRGGR